MGELANAIWSARLAACSTTAAVFSMALSMAVPRKAARAADDVDDVRRARRGHEVLHGGCVLRVTGRERSGEVRSATAGGRVKKTIRAGCVSRCRIRRASAHLGVPGRRATRG